MLNIILTKLKRRVNRMKTYKEYLLGELKSFEQAIKFNKESIKNLKERIKEDEDNIAFLDSIANELKKSIDDID
jgi:hypothetical protein